MSKRPDDLSGYKRAIVIEFERCDISVNQLYFGYFQTVRLEAGLHHSHGLGPDAFRSWCDGRTEPGVSEYPLVQQTMARRLREIGKEPSLPELPFLNPGPQGDDGVPVDSPATRTTKGGYLTTPAEITRLNPATYPDRLAS